MTMSKAAAQRTAQDQSPPVDQARRRLLTIAAGGAVAATMPNAAATIEATDGTDAEILDAIDRWRALWGAEEALPDFDPGGAELRRQAYDLEWAIAEMEPAAVAGYYAKRDAIRNFDFDHEDSIEILWQLAHDAGRLGVDREMPDVRTPC
jgi:hypothetical protein